MIAVLSALAPACGMLTLAVGVYDAAMESPTVAAAGGSDQVRLAAAVAEHGPVLVLGLLLGIAGAFSWFILVHRAAVHRFREVEALLNGHGPIEGLSREMGVLPLVRGRSE